MVERLLTEHGYQMTVATAAKKRCEGGGPTYIKLANGRVVYEAAD